MICLYEKNETNFTFNGLGTLEPTECSFLPSINGVWSLKMTLPVDPEGKSNLIENDKIIKVTGIDCIEEQTSEYQLFRIYDFRKEQNYVYVTALPVGLDARFDTFVDSIKFYDETPAQVVNSINALSDKYTVSLESPQYWSNDPKSGEYTKANIISILNGEKGFVQTWGGEICYDNYSIKMEHHMGTYTPVDVRYGKNIIGMSYDMDSSNVVTRLYPKAKSGEILNGVSDYSISVLPTPYVDADNASDYPIDHIYAVDTPYNLVQLSNDGSAEYLDSQNLFDAIMQTTRFWLHTGLLNSTSGYYTSAPLLEDVELDWIVNNYALTTEKDGVEGIVEHMWRQVITNSTHNIVSKSVQNLIYNAMKAAFDEVLTDDESGWYIGASSKKLWSDGFGQYFYSYTWDAGGQFRVNGNGIGYAWVYANSKWNQLDSSGTTTGATDKATWKWFKVKNKKWKRYGNKKKSRYLHHQTWKINDVWYWFKNDGEPQKGSALYNEWILFFDNKAVAYEQGVEPTTLYGALIPICTEGEKLLFQRLYNRMEEYCEELFDADKLSYPTINIDINFADLSQTVEYQNYSFLEKIHLGDAVNIRNDKLGVLLTERIIGLTYDVLRNYNTEIHIGLTESSVVNLLDSIGKTDNQVKFVAGDGITIEGNTISVIPPSTPYLEDVLVNGESVVRNHKAYIDLDAMGIDEGTHVLYGTEEPTSDDGEDNDIYVKLKPSLTPQDLELTTESVWEQLSISRDTDLTYDIELGATSNPTDEFIAYKIKGIKAGKTYTFSFDAKFSEGTTFYPTYEQQGELTGEAIVGITFQNTAEYHNYLPAYPNEYNEEKRYMSFYRDTTQHHYENTFVATSDTMYMIAEFNGVVDGHYNTLELTDLSIREYEIEKVYFKYEDDWMKAGATANPSNPATANLTKIKIDGIVYNISGGGGGGSSVIYGTSTPTVSQGTDGALYMQVDNKFLIFEGTATTQRWIDPLHYSVDMAHADSITLTFKAGTNAEQTETINVSSITNTCDPTDPEWDGCNRWAYVPNTSNKIAIGYSTTNPTYVSFFTATSYKLELYFSYATISNAYQRIKDIFGFYNSGWLKYTPFNN